jgi:flagellar basal-body rod modification protein FlgD
MAVTTVSNKFPATPTYTGPQPAAAPTGKSKLSKDDFLQLLVTQLKNQDPTSPLQPYELAAQLAQFTSVEQLTNLNTQIASQLAAINSSTQAAQTNLGAGLIGRQVVAKGDMVAIPASGQGRVLVDVGDAGGIGTLTLSDAAGATVATVDLGQVQGGRQAIALPAGIAPGAYHYALKVKSAAGADVAVTTYTAGLVDSLQIQNGAPVLGMGPFTVPIDSIVEVSPISTSSQESPIP